MKEAFQYPSQRFALYLPPNFVAYLDFNETPLKSKTLFIYTLIGINPHGLGAFLTLDWPNGLFCTLMFRETMDAITSQMRL